MKIVVLGCSGGIGAGLKTTSLLVGDSVLIDAGTGMCDLPAEQLGRIRDIFVTHSHLDHVAGIPLLVDTIFDSLRSPLTVHGRTETLQALQRHIFNGVIWPDFSQLPSRARPVLRFEPMAPGQTREVEGGSVEMIAVNHVVPAAGYRIAGEHGKALAFSGDTTTNDQFWQQLNRHPGLDFLIVESAFPNRDLELSRLAHHYCPQLLAADLDKLRHHPKVYIGHLKPGAEQQILQECREAIRGFAVDALRGGEAFDL